MGRKLYVTNLAYGVQDRELQKLFQAHGTVASAQVAVDRDTGRSKGFGFVEMKTDQEAQAAVAGLNGKELDGRVLAVSEARPREEGRGARRPTLGGRGRRRLPPLGKLLRHARPQTEKGSPGGQC